MRSAPKPVGEGGSVRVPPECTRVRRATTGVFRMRGALSFTPGRTRVRGKIRRKLVFNF